MASEHQPTLPLALCIQPACLEHKYIRHANSSHIFERPERIRAVLLGVAAALSRLETQDNGRRGGEADTQAGVTDDIATMLSGLSIASGSSPFLPPSHVHILLPPTPPSSPGQVLLHHPALQLAHTPPIEAPFPYLPVTRGAAIPSSTYLRDLYKWASNAVEAIKTTGCEIPEGLGLNPGDLYLGPGTVLAIEGAIQTVCQAVDGVCGRSSSTPSRPSTPSTPGSSSTPPPPAAPSEQPLPPFNKAFCAIRPPGHHCGEDEPSGFCYVNNVVVGALHGYLQHDVDRAIIIDFDLHHGNGTQALVMPHNAASYAEDLAVAAGKPPQMRGSKGRPRRGWKAFYGSVHDIYSYPCEDGDLDLIKDASISLAAHGQYIENIHLQPYASEEDFYERIYPKYLALLEKARVFMQETDADPERTILFISAGFDACEHEHQGMQRHDRRVPVSFYSRYTRDIAAFADKHTLGKVVSVLEGGYGDRALTSAAMGHAIGLMGREGVPAWWSVDELVLLERAAKKRRKGKLCALGPDLASNPHLARSHALLAHFEGAAPPETPVPSVNATPQARMTLRTRKPAEYVEAEDESPVPRTARRGRQPKSSANTPTPTPRRKGVDAQQQPEAAAPVVVGSAQIDPTPSPLPVTKEIVKEEPVGTRVLPVPDNTVNVKDVNDKELLLVSKGPDVYPSPESSVASPTAPSFMHTAAATTAPEPSAEKIMLRIPRITPASSPSPTADEDDKVSPSLRSLVPPTTTAPPAPVANHPAPPFTATGSQQQQQPMTFRPGAMEPVVLPPTPVKPSASSSRSTTASQYNNYSQQQPPQSDMRFRMYPSQQYPAQPRFPPTTSASPSAVGVYPSIPVVAQLPTLSGVPGVPRHYHDGQLQPADAPRGLDLFQKPASSSEPASSVTRDTNAKLDNATTSAAAPSRHLYYPTGYSAQ